MPMINVSFSISAGGVRESLSLHRLRYQTKPTPKEAGDPEQYQLFDAPEYSYRVLVAPSEGPLWQRQKSPRRHWLMAAKVPAAFDVMRTDNRARKSRENETHGAAEGCSAINS
jgi:hypothetical protein